MSDSVCDVKPTEADGFGVPTVLMESQRPIISSRFNPSPALPGSLPPKRHDVHLSDDDAYSAETTPHTTGESSVLLGMLLPSAERPKSGLTKTKRNLKKQLHLKMAALDDGRQTPNLPSPSLCPEDARASTATTSLKDVESTELMVSRGEEQHELNSTTERQNLPVTVKVEVPDDGYPSSSQPRNSSAQHFESSCANEKTAVPEGICPSPNDMVSQSGPEVAGPTKWIIGDMLWARVSGHPWWPCMVAYDPAHTAFTRTLKRRQGSLVQYHVRFFGDENERGWINESSIIPFEGLEAFTKFCSEMMTLHKKDRQNYVVPARRLKAWNIAVKSAQEAYPMTRAFRVHHFAFVYNEPVVANGATAAPVQRAESTQSSKKGIKRSRSSSVGGCGDSRPKKRQRTSGEKMTLVSGSIQGLLTKTDCVSPGSAASDQADRSNSVLCDAISQHEPGSAVFRSRAEGVKRSSRFVKPTNRIMEHLEEVQQRKRTKLRPHRKLVAHDESATSEIPAKAQKADLEETLTSSDEMLNMSQVTCDENVSNVTTSETPSKKKKPELPNSLTAPDEQEANEVCCYSAKTLGKTELAEIMETDLVEKVNQNLQENTTANNVLPEKMDTGFREELMEMDSPENTDFREKMTSTGFPEEVLGKMTDEILTKSAQRTPAISTMAEAAHMLDAVVKIEMEQSANRSSNHCEVSTKVSPSHPHASPDVESLSHRCRSPEAVASICKSDCEPVASTTMAVPINEVPQPGLGLSTDVGQGSAVRKRQKRTFKQNKDLVRSNLRSSGRETRVKNSEADDKDWLPEEEQIHVPTHLLLSAGELSSSGLPPTEKLKKPPGRRKLSVSTAQLVEEDGNAEPAQPETTADAITNGIFTCSPRSSRFPSQPEFQRLSSVGPQKVDNVCHICEQSGDVLIDCQGPCYGSYHLSCLGLVVSPVGSFRCDECSTGNHPCFVCKHTSRDTVPCCTSKCGRFYHRDCISKFPLCKLDSNSVTCPHHTCATCAVESGKNGRASKGLMYRCIRCPTAYHANDFCIAAGTVLIAGYNIICNSHLLAPKSPKRAVLHVNATWCFVCSKEGSPLVLCSSCPAAFHLACAKIGQVSEPWQCKDCTLGKRPLYGEVVWAKVGSYRWWPSEVCHSKNVSVQILNKVHEPGNFVVRLCGTGFQFWIQQGRVFPFHEGDHLSHEPVYRKMTDIFEKAVAEATEVYRLRLAAREAKTISERDKNDQKPAYYKHIKINMPLGDVEIYKIAPSEIPSCHCTPTMENPCGPDSDCINRLMMYECNALVCPAGERCQNQRFQKREDADARPYKTELRGWGLRSRADIKKGQFIAEYVGDLVDPDECNRRQEYAQRNNITNFYMLTLDKNRIIDAGPKGNYSRFMNHSCEPNCETQKWTVNGDIRVGLFALHDIPAGTELTFNYNLDCYGNQKTMCKCGSTICSGFLGVRPKTAAAVNVERKSREAKLKKQLKEIKSKDRPDVCYSCKKKGGELIICESPKCFKAYHPRCVRLSNQTDGKFICPWHKCENCGQDSSKLCSVCPRSFCLVHLTSNIFEISDGSLVCSKHQNILVSCLQDGWKSSVMDGLSPGANGLSLAPVGNHCNMMEASSLKCAKPARKQTAGNGNTLASAKRRKCEAVTEGESTVGVIPQTELKKKGRPMKNVQNGVLEGAAEQNRVDSSTGSLTDKKLKTAPVRRSRCAAKATDKDSLAEACAGQGKNVRDRRQQEEKVNLAALDMSIHQMGEVALSSGKLAATGDPAAVNIEKLSRTNGPENRTVTLDGNVGLSIGAEQEDKLPRLVIDESY